MAHVRVIFIELFVLWAVSSISSGPKPTAGILIPTFVNPYPLAASQHDSTMIQTFLYRTEKKEKSFHHKVYSLNIEHSLDKWINQIEDQQNKVYSFDSNEVKNIRQQYLSGRLKVNIDHPPYFLSYEIDRDLQIVYIDRVNKREPDFIGKVTYFTAKEGGRVHYAASGYRPNLKFAGQNDLTSGEQIFVDKDKVFPGQSAIAEIRMTVPDHFANQLYVGQSFEFGEGPNAVGHGVIVDIVNPILRQASR